MSLYDPFKARFARILILGSPCETFKFGRLKINMLFASLSLWLCSWLNLFKIFRLTPDSLLATSVAEKRTCMDWPLESFLVKKLDGPFVSLKQANNRSFLTWSNQTEPPEDYRAILTGQQFKSSSSRRL